MCYCDADGWLYKAARGIRPLREQYTCAGDQRGPTKVRLPLLEEGMQQAFLEDASKVAGGLVTLWRHNDPNAHRIINQVHLSLKPIGRAPCNLPSADKGIQQDVIVAQPCAGPHSVASENRVLNPLCCADLHIHAVVGLSDGVPDKLHISGLPSHRRS